MTRFLRFPSEARAVACMSHWHSADLGWHAPVRGWAIDVVGPIDGHGFHLNLIGDVPAKATPFEVTPANPRRVFAG